jgi:hypothetical protein
MRPVVSSAWLRVRSSVARSLAQSWPETRQSQFVTDQFAHMVTVATPDFVALGVGGFGSGETVNKLPRGRADFAIALVVS